MEPRALICTLNRTGSSLRRGLRRSFFFQSRRRHTRCLSDWSSDVCSSDLEALAQTLPLGGHAFTAERERVPFLERVARRRGTTLQVVDDAGVTGAELAGFSYFEHAENVALALAVCGHLGVDRARALAGMQAAAPDPGVLRRYTVRSGAREVEFVNAFAANDPDSTLLIWRRLGLERREPGVRRIVLANCRADRIQRSGQIAELVGRRLDPDLVVLTGAGTALVAWQAVRHGLPAARIHDFGGSHG